MKRGANPSYNRKNGPVTSRKASRDNLKFQRQKHGRGWVKSSRQIGDLRPMFGKEYVAFRGGEGGRNWSIPATEI